MILYHGSNVEVKEPILLKVQRELDFGKGFYTTSDMEQAARWAWRTAKRRGESNAFVTVYEVNEDGIFTGKVTPMWDAKSKQKAIADFCKMYEIDLTKSYAYGDTTGDLTMFKNVGNAIAINPAKKLLQKIKRDKELKEKVMIVVERKDVIYKLKADVDII